MSTVENQLLYIAVGTVGPTVSDYGARGPVLHALRKAYRLGQRRARKAASRKAWLASQQGAKALAEAVRAGRIKLGVDSHPLRYKAVAANPEASLSDHQTVSLQGLKRHVVRPDRRPRVTLHRGL